MKSLIVSSDKASDKAIAVWNDLNRISKLGERVAKDHRLGSIFNFGAGGKLVRDGPSTKLYSQILLL
jgi:hypothetical protein